MINYAVTRCGLQPGHYQKIISKTNVQSNVYNRIFQFTKRIKMSTYLLYIADFSRIHYIRYLVYRLNFLKNWPGMEKRYLLFILKLLMSWFIHLLYISCNVLTQFQAEAIVLMSVYMHGALLHALFWGHAHSTYETRQSLHTTRHSTGNFSRLVIFGCFFKFWGIMVWMYILKCTNDIDRQTHLLTCLNKKGEIEVWFLFCKLRLVFTP